MGSKMVNPQQQFSTVGGNPFMTVPNDIIDELISRFIMNIPVEERQDLTRVSFQIELAHWFFVDHYCAEDKSDYWKNLGRIKFPEFTALIFQRTPFLQKHIRNLDKIIQDFREYKMKVPTFGGILMNEQLTKVVLVQGFGGQWGFPKGKINKDEDPADCAAREVLEETGYDCSPLLNRNNYIESCCNERWTRLYIIRGVDRTSVMKPHTRYEIKNIAWFNICELPENKKDTSVAARPGFPHTAFHTVFPYVKRLRRWIDDKLAGKNELEFFRSNAPNRPYHVLDRGGGGGDDRKKRDSGSDREKHHQQDTKTNGTKPNNSNSNNRILQQQQGMQLLNLLGTPQDTRNQTEKEIKAESQSTTTFVKHINPKRRLFTSDEDEETDEVKKLSKLKISHVPVPNNKLVVKTTKTESKKSGAFVSDLLLSPSPTWLNFKLNADEIIRSMSLKPASSNKAQRRK